MADRTITPEMIEEQDRGFNETLDRLAETALEVKGERDNLVRLLRDILSRDGVRAALKAVDDGGPITAGNSDWFNARAYLRKIGEGGAL